MCCVARGSTSGRVMRSAATSARNCSSVALGQLLDRLAGGGGAADDLVVDVGDVHHPADLVAAVPQVADQQVDEQERAEIADVRRAVDRRAAAVDPRRCRVEQLERPLLDASVSSSRSVTRGAPGRPRRGRDRPPGTLVARQVAGRGLDAHCRRVEAEQPRDRRSHRVERAPNRGRAPTIVTSTRRARKPAAATARRPRAGVAARDALGRRAAAGKSRPRSPSAAPPRSASATAWSATSPSEWPCSRGAPAIATPPSRSGAPGPNGWLS